MKVLFKGKDINSDKKKKERESDKFMKNADLKFYFYKKIQHSVN